jgi:hypothetical protein
VQEVQKDVQVQGCIKSLLTVQHSKSDLLPEVQPSREDKGPWKDAGSPDEWLYEHDANMQYLWHKRDRLEDWFPQLREQLESKAVTEGGGSAQERPGERVFD